MLIRSKSVNPLKDWQVNRDEIRFLGKDLQRPECILTEPDGTVWSADARGGVIKMKHDGMQIIINPSILNDESEKLGNTNVLSLENDNARYISAIGSLPNGLCFDKNGDIIIANWGTNNIEKMTREGRMTTILTEIDGKTLGKTNFPLRDTKGRIWFTVTTCTEPWSDQINTRAMDGYIVLMVEKGARIVADGFCGTNESRLDDKEEWLHVVESTA